MPEEAIKIAGEEGRSREGAWIEIYGDAINKVKIASLP